MKNELMMPARYVPVSEDEQWNITGGAVLDAASVLRGIGTMTRDVLNLSVQVLSAMGVVTVNVIRAALPVISSALNLVADGFKLLGNIRF